VRVFSISITFRFICSFEYAPLSVNISSPRRPYRDGVFEKERLYTLTSLLCMVDKKENIRSRPYASSALVFYILSFDPQYSSILSPFLVCLHPYQ